MEETESWEYFGKIPNMRTFSDYPILLESYSVDCIEQSIVDGIRRAAAHWISEPKKFAILLVSEGLVINFAIKAHELKAYIMTPLNTTGRTNLYEMFFS